MKLFVRSILVLFLIAVISIPALYMFGPATIQNKIKRTAGSIVSGSFLNKLFTSEEPKPSDTELITKSESFYIWKDARGSEHYVTSLNDIPKEFINTAVKMDSDSMKGEIKLMSEKENAQAMKAIETRPQPEQLKDAEYQILIYSYKGNKELKEAADYFDKFNLPYKILDVIEKPEYAAELKMKLGLDINKKYSNINFPVIEINGEIIKRKKDEKDEAGNVTGTSGTSLDTEKINKKLGLRTSYTAE